MVRIGKVLNVRRHVRGHGHVAGVDELDQLVGVADAREVRVVHHVGHRVDDVGGGRAPPEERRDEPIPAARVPGVEPLNQDVALLTGGADMNIGRDAARRLRRHGARTVGGDTREADGVAACREPRKRGAAAVGRERLVRGLVHRHRVAVRIQICARGTRGRRHASGRCRRRRVEGDHRGEPRVRLRETPGPPRVDRTSAGRHHVVRLVHDRRVRLHRQVRKPLRTRPSDESVRRGH